MNRPGTSDVGTRNGGVRAEYETPIGFRYRTFDFDGRPTQTGPQNTASCRNKYTKKCNPFTYFLDWHFLSRRLFCPENIIPFVQKKIYLPFCVNRQCNYVVIDLFIIITNWSMISDIDHIVFEWKNVLLSFYEAISI